MRLALLATLLCLLTAALAGAAEPRLSLRTLPGATVPKPVEVHRSAVPPGWFSGLADLPLPPTPAQAPPQLPRPTAGMRTLPPPAKPVTRPPPPAEVPLQLAEYAPEGEVTVGAELRLLFSRPVRSLDAEAKPPDAEIVPAVAGKWRWTDLRTARFEHADPWPAATEFRVRVRVDGKVTAWTFRTPPPKLTYHEFADKRAPNPLVGLHFDQRVDRKVVAAHVRVAVDGRAVSVELAEDTTLLFRSADSDVVPLRVMARDRDWRRMQVDLPAGLGSAEGPLRTVRGQGVELERKPPVLEKVTCDEDVRDNMRSLSLWFEESTPPDLEGCVRTEPPVAIEISGRTVRGPFRTGATYRVFVCGEAEGWNGLRAGREQAADVVVGPPAPRVWISAGGIGRSGFVHLADHVTVVALHATQVQVEVFRMATADLDADLGPSRWGDTEPKVRWPRRPVWQKTFFNPNTLTVSLLPALRSGTGIVGVRVSAPNTDESATWWGIKTNLDLSVFQDGGHHLVHVWNRRTGQAAKGVRVWPGRMRTDAHGMAKLPGRANRVRVERGGDVAQVPTEKREDCSSDSYARPLADEWLWFFTDDGGMYRPGSPVRVKAWVRKMERGPKGDLSLPGENKVQWGLETPDGRAVQRGTATIDAHGGVSVTTNLPADAAPGEWLVYFGSPGPKRPIRAWSEGTGVHAIRVSEHVRPNFEARVAGPTSVVVAGEPMELTVDASYFAGGPLPGAAVTWRVETERGSPWLAWRNEQGYQFGARRPEAVGLPSDGTLLQGRTDTAGTHRLGVDPAPPAPRLPGVLEFTATVLDGSGKARTAAPWSVVVLPSRVMVGVLANTTQNSVTVRAITRAPDGRTVPGRQLRIRVTTERHGQTPLVQTCSLVSSTTEVTCALRVPSCHKHAVLVQTSDAEGRLAESEIDAFSPCEPDEPSVPGGERATALAMEVTRTAAGLDVRVHSPHREDGEALLMVLRDGIAHAEPMPIRAGEGRVQLPVPKHWSPGVHVLAGLPRAGGYLELHRPEGDELGIRIELPARHGLKLGVTAPSRVVPGARAPLVVAVRDEDGLPVAGAQVALVVVDDAVLALNRHRLVDPLETFELQRPGWIRAYRLGEGSCVQNGIISLCNGALRAESAALARPNQGPTALRNQFNAVAAFLPALETGPDGIARAEIALPHDLTRWHVLAYASAGVHQFGSGEATFQAGLPLAVRISSPRFASVGDRFELAALVQNLSDHPMDVTVAARASGLVVPAEALKLTVPAQGRSEVHWPVVAKDPGIAVVQVLAVAGDYRDAQEATFEVVRPTVARQDAWTVELGPTPVRVALQPGADAEPSLGGLELRSAATPLLELEPVLQQMVANAWPWPGSLAARIQGLAALTTLYGNGQVAGPQQRTTQEELTESVRSLVRLRLANGGESAGWAWPGSREPDGWTTARATHALTLAARAGVPVAERLRPSAAEATQRLTALPTDSTATSAQIELHAYGLYVRHLAGSDVRKEAATAAAALEVRAPATVLAWLHAILQSPDLKRQLAARIARDGDRAHLGDGRGDQAMVLDALGDDPLGAGLARALLAERDALGFGGETADAFALSGLARQWRGLAGSRPQVRAWLGDQLVAEHRPQNGADTTVVPMSKVLETRPAELVLQASSPAWVRVGLDVVSHQPLQAQHDRGLTVSRRYLPVVHNSDVQLLANGRVRVKVGALVQVIVDVTTPLPRTQVSVREFLPAGLEVVDPTLAGEAEPVHSEHRPAFYAVLRDRRVDGFAHHLPMGTYRLQFLARATTVGTFAAPPARAVQLDAPETAGQSAGTTVEVMR